MVYLAIILVLLGLFCFVYVFYKQYSKEQYHSKKTAKTNGKKKYEVDNQYTLFNLRYPEHKDTSEYEARIRLERSLGRKITNVNQENITDVYHTFSREKVIPYSTVIENSKNEDDESKTHIDNNIKILDVGFSISGILYLDYGKQIPFESKKIKEMDWMEDNFTKFKRVGPATMEEKEGNFVFMDDDSQIQEYHVHSLEQIVFLDGAFSLIPTNSESPVPVFFTDEIEKFKKFLAGNN